MPRSAPTVATDPDGRVVVDDILENSDAYRRGLRYGDELLRFAGREIGTANAFKNIAWHIPQRLACSAHVPPRRERSTTSKFASPQPTVKASWKQLLQQRRRARTRTASAKNTSRNPEKRHDLKFQISQTSPKATNQSLARTARNRQSQDASRAPQSSSQVLRSRPRLRQLLVQSLPSTACVERLSRPRRFRRSRLELENHREDGRWQR